MTTVLPKRQTRRFHKREEATRLFIDAALEALRRDGLAGLTVQRLAADTGYAVGALYRHFASKEALLIAVQSQVVADLDRDLETVLETAGHMVASRNDVPAETLPILALLVAGLCYEALAIRRPAHFALISHSLAEPRHLVGTADAAMLLPSLLALLGRVGGTIEVAALTGTLHAGDTNRRTLLLWSTVHGVLLLRKLQRYDPTDSFDDGLTLDAVATLLLGWGADPALVAAAREMAGTVISQAFAEEEPR
jgi:AcrR family transcriptional regulator